MKGDAGVRCFQAVLIFGNLVIGLCGIALTAECIYFVSDQHGLYPLLEATDNDDIYAAAWIGIFTGFSLFVLAILGIIGIMKSNRRILLAYLILMFIVFCFEAASAITAATQRDFNKCCGVNGPSDWQDYTSAFRLVNSDSAFPWPRQCCVLDSLGEPLNQVACNLGVPEFLHTTGCYDQIAGPLMRHAWGVAWFGFAILCWTFWVLLGSMFYWTRIEY